MNGTSPKASASGIDSKPYRSTARRAFYEGRLEADKFKVPDIVNVELPSVSSVLRSLGYGVDTRARSRFLAALDNLKTTKAHFPTWHSKRDGQVDRWFEPMIKSLVFRDGHRITVAINGEWLDRCFTYFAKVPLPLPLENSKNAESATVTKLLLWLLAWDRSPAKSPYSGIPQMAPPNRRQWQHRGHPTAIPALSCHDRPWSAFDRADWAMRNPAP